MILHRLYELAIRQGLLDDPAFETQPVPYIIQLKDDGAYLGIEPRPGPPRILGKNKGGAPKVARGKGVPLSVPKAHGNAANRGFARYFADTLPRVLPLTDDAKSANSRATFWAQIDRAAGETDDPSLRAVLSFGRRIVADMELQTRVRADVESLTPDAGDRCTFAWFPHGNETIVQQEPIRSWYRAFFAAVQGERQEAGPRGLCQITKEIGPLARSHSTVIKGVPGGIASGVMLVSNDKAAFESYALDGAANASISPRAAEGYARALNGLIHRQGEKSLLFPGHSTCLRVGATVFAFWTREPDDLDDFMALDKPTTDAVARLMESPKTGRESPSGDPEKFYCLCLSGNAARAIVRNYLEIPLAVARESLRRWFGDLRIIDDTKEGHCQPNNLFPLWMLASATARELGEASPSLLAELYDAAVEARPLPDSVLAACLQRIRVESGPYQFGPARMALIRLLLNRRPERGDMLMSESLDPQLASTSQAYACGRLLAFLARCQSPKKFGTDAQVLERYYGAASTAPRSVFPVLLRMNRHHIAKIRGEQPGFAFNLEAELEEQLAPFRPAAGQVANFKALLSLPEQGQFALGFYHQRADYRKQSDDNKARRLAGTAETLPEQAPTP